MIATVDQRSLGDQHQQQSGGKGRGRFKTQQAALAASDRMSQKLVTGAFVPEPPKEKKGMFGLFSRKSKIESTFVEALLTKPGGLLSPRKGGSGGEAADEGRNADGSMTEDGAAARIQRRWLLRKMERHACAVTTIASHVRKAQSQKSVRALAKVAAHEQRRAEARGEKAGWWKQEAKAGGQERHYGSVAQSMAVDRQLIIDAQTRMQESHVAMARLVRELGGADMDRNEWAGRLRREAGVLPPSAESALGGFVNRGIETHVDSRLEELEEERRHHAVVRANIGKVLERARRVKSGLNSHGDSPAKLPVMQLNPAVCAAKSLHYSFPKSEGGKLPGAQPMKRRRPKPAPPTMTTTSASSTQFHGESSSRGHGPSHLSYSQRVRGTMSTGAGGRHVRQPIDHGRAGVDRIDETRQSWADSKRSYVGKSWAQSAVKAPHSSLSTAFAKPFEGSSVRPERNALGELPTFDDFGKASTARKALVHPHVEPGLGAPRRAARPTRAGEYTADRKEGEYSAATGRIPYSSGYTRPHASHTHGEKVSKVGPLARVSGNGNEPLLREWEETSRVKKRVEIEQLRSLKRATAEATALEVEVIQNTFGCSRAEAMRRVEESRMERGMRELEVKMREMAWQAETRGGDGQDPAQRVAAARLQAAAEGRRAVKEAQAALVVRMQELAVEREAEAFSAHPHQDEHDEAAATQSKYHGRQTGAGHDDQGRSRPDMVAVGFGSGTRKNDHDEAADHDVEQARLRLEMKSMDKQIVRRAMRDQSNHDGAKSAGGAEPQWNRGWRHAEQEILQTNLKNNMQDMEAMIVSMAAKAEMTQDELGAQYAQSISAADAAGASDTAADLLALAEGAAVSAVRAERHADELAEGLTSNVRGTTWYDANAAAEATGQPQRTQDEMGAEYAKTGVRQDGTVDSGVKVRRSSLKKLMAAKRLAKKQGK